MFQDLRYALRTLSRSPSFALVAIVTLALGIGANTAIFSVVDSVLLRPLPYPDPDALMNVASSRQKGSIGNASWLDYVDWRAQTRSFGQMAAWHDDSVIFAGKTQPERLQGVSATANFFDVLGVPPMLGRGFLPGEDVAGNNRVVVLAYATWRDHFGGDAAVVGTSVRLDDEPYTIVGVTGPDAGFVVQPKEPEFYLPLLHGGLDAAMRNQRGAHYLYVLARLAPGASVVQARLDLEAVQAHLAEEFPDADAKRYTTVTPLHELLTSDVRPALLVLLFAVAFVLLIACANVANLLLARATSRQRELAIRVALGASRGRLIRQMLTESVVLGVLGGALGLLLALWGLDALRAVIPAELGRIHRIAVDGRVLAFTGGLSIVTSVIFGLLPALQSSGPNPHDALKEGARSTSGRRQRLRQVLVSAEIALALLLLIGAGLMLRSFQRLGQVDPGFVAKDVLTVQMLLPATHYPGDPEVIAFYKSLEDKVAALPGAPAVAIGLPLPFSDTGISLRFQVADQPVPAHGTEPIATLTAVNPDWFHALGIKLVRGRVFTNADDSATAPPVIVINETLARQMFGGEDPLGKRIVVGDKPGEREIVGIVGDVHTLGLEAEPPMALYVPFAQGPYGFIAVGVATSQGTAFTPNLRAALNAVDPSLPLGDTAMLEDLLRDSTGTRRLSTLLLGLFAATALLLALVGVYGVMSFAVTQRTREIGLRMALGARPGDVIRWVVGQALALAVAGVVLGVGGALALSRLLAGMLYGVAATDPVTYVAVSLMLIVIAAFASWFPARRAARVDPMVALRAE